MGRLASITGKSGALGALVAAMGCSFCFPALGALGASIGLGFLAQWEELFVTTLIPIFVGLVVLANIANFRSHRIWWRLLLGLLGPAMVLIPLEIVWVDAWATTMLTAGVVVMIGVSIFDLIRPAGATCSSDSGVCCPVDPVEKSK